MKLEVGQTLWCVKDYLGRDDAGREVVVEKVGRKWAWLSNRYRIAIDTLVIDGGEYSSPGRCYVDREAYESELARRKAWMELREAVASTYTAPAHLTGSAIYGLLARIRNPL